jgi:hypothetical protein
MWRALGNNSRTPWTGQAVAELPHVGLSLGLQAKSRHGAQGHIPIRQFGILSSGHSVAYIHSETWRIQLGGLKAGNEACLPSPKTGGA